MASWTGLTSGTRRVDSVLALDPGAEKKLLFAACLGDIHWQVAEERQGVEAVAQIAPAEQRDLTGSLRPN